VAIRILATQETVAAEQLFCSGRIVEQKPPACYLIVPVQLLDTARAKCQTFPVFERFSKAFPI
jgi:hypothetical protein